MAMGFACADMAVDKVDHTDLHLPIVARFRGSTSAMYKVAVQVVQVERMVEVLPALRSQLGLARLAAAQALLLPVSCALRTTVFLDLRRVYLVCS